MHEFEHVRDGRVAPGLDVQCGEWTQVLFGWFRREWTVEERDLGAEVPNREHQLLRIESVEWAWKDPRRSLDPIGKEEGGECLQVQAGELTLSSVGGRRVRRESECEHCVLCQCRQVWEVEDQVEQVAKRVQREEERIESQVDWGGGLGEQVGEPRREEPKAGEAILGLQQHQPCGLHDGWTGEEGIEP